MAIKIRQDQALSVGHLIGIVTRQLPGQSRYAWTDTVAGPATADWLLNFICVSNFLEINMIPHIGHVIVSHE